MMKTTTSWPQDTWKVNICSFGWEISENVKCPKMTIFSQVCGHEKLQFFWLSGKSLKLMKITTSWPQDTWNVNICPFRWEICKFVKCPKWHFWHLLLEQWQKPVIKSADWKYKSYQSLVKIRYHFISAAYRFYFRYPTKHRQMEEPT